MFHDVPATKIPENARENIQKFLKLRVFV